MPPRHVREADFDLVEPPVVVVAEDDDTFRQLLSAMFRRDGYIVIPVADGASLLRALGAEAGPRPELVVSDIRMPGPSGVQVLASLRRTDGATPVILMTGFGDAEVEARAFELGATAVFSKPFALEDLRRRVAELLPIV